MLAAGKTPRAISARASRRFPTGLRWFLTACLTAIVFVAPGTGCETANTQPRSDNADGSNPPKTLEIFEPNSTSEFKRWTFTPSFSKDMKTLCVVSWENPDLTVKQSTMQKLYQSRMVDGRWSVPVEVKETSGHRVDWCHYSPDGRFFLLSYTKPHSKQYDYPNEKDFVDFDIWIAPTNEKGDIDWKNFKPIDGGDINRAKTPANRNRGYVHNETAPRMDLAGNLYFWTERLDDGGGQRDIYYASVKSLENLEWNTAEILPAPINTEYRESGVAVSKEGDWIIFASARPGGFGGEDLYFSRRIGGNGWSEPKNLGREINSPNDDVVPELSPDNRTLYFSSNRPKPNEKQTFDPDGNSDTWAVYRIAVESFLILER